MTERAFRCMSRAVLSSGERPLMNNAIFFKSLWYILGKPGNENIFQANYEKLIPFRFYLLHLHIIYSAAFLLNFYRFYIV